MPEQKDVPSEAFQPPPATSMAHYVSEQKSLIDGAEAVASKVNMPSVQPLVNATTTYIHSLNEEQSRYI